MRRIREKSLYDISKTLGTQRKNEGYNYKTGSLILRNTLSPYMFQNIDVSEFLEFINNGMVINIEAIKSLRVFINYTVDKNTKYIN